MGITSGQVLKYSALPGLFPRFREVFTVHFVYLAYYMAFIFKLTGLLPNNHPYLNPENVGRYSLRNVIAESANNLVWSKKNIDQIAIFFLMITGIILIFVQVIALGVSFIIQPAVANTFAALFFEYAPAESPAQDLAMILMDRVFGVPGIFESCISTTTNCLDAQGREIPTTGAFPYPVHYALHSMMAFYTYGIMFIGFLIILYYATTVLAETTMTGTPFGKRFDKAWVPVRIILFMGLLIPVTVSGTAGSGTATTSVSSAQYLMLYGIKIGSNFASNIWHLFTQETENRLLSNDPRDLIATPNFPELGSLAQFMFLAKLCQKAEADTYQTDVRAYVVRPVSIMDLGEGGDTQYFKEPSWESIEGYRDDLEFSEFGSIVIQFGYPKVEEPNLIEPVCGELVIPTLGNADYFPVNIQGNYYVMIGEMFSGTIRTPGSEELEPGRLAAITECFYERKINGSCENAEDYPDDDFAREYTLRLRNAAEVSLETLRQSDDFDDFVVDFFSFEDTVMEKGWGGAAIWYNLVAKMNGDVTSSIVTLPRPDKYPNVMELVYQERSRLISNPQDTDRFNPIIYGDQEVTLPRTLDIQSARILHEGHQLWADPDNPATATSRTTSTGNAVLDTINAIFGSAGLFNMRDPSQDHIHPLAKLSSLGKGLIDASIRNLLIASGGVVAQGLLSSFNFMFGAGVAGVGTEFITSTVTIGMLIGFMLYYMLPFLPFIYFFFAIAKWVKSVFEAMVALPLWALAHLSIDGPGIPGRGASNGYFLITEIIIRPSLILAGLLASIMTFAATILILNEIFDLVVDNVSGINPAYSDADAVDAAYRLSYLRGTLDQFMFTLIYAVIVYLLALSSFKLIDLVPNQILRWMGFTVKTFQETLGANIEEQMISRTYQAGNIYTAQISGTLSGPQGGGRLAALTNL